MELSTIELTMIRNFFSHGCNTAMVVLLACWSAIAILGVWSVHIVLVLLGAATFLVSEYGFHRFVLHARPARAGSRIRRLQHRLHYDHHSQPSRLDLLFLPFWFLVPSLALTTSLAAWIWPDAGRVTSLLAGILLALLHYEWTHYLAHIPYRPRTPWGRWMKHTHLWHHFSNEHYWFGVTNPSLDVLFGTYAAPARVDRSSTVRAIDRA